MCGRGRVLLVLLMLTALPLAGCLGADTARTPLGETRTPPGSEPAPPVAMARADVNRTQVGVPVVFTSAGSDDPDGLIERYEWELGDGTVLKGPVVRHAFAAAGTYAVTLTVTDDDGLTASDAVTVTVEGGNRPPVAVLDVTDTRGRPAASGDAGHALVFTARDSRDPDGDALTYRWTFGDGATATAETVRHTFDRPGTYVVRLTVADAHGREATSSRVVTQNLNATWDDEGFDATDAKGAAQAFPLPVPAGAREVRVTLTFESPLNTADLGLRLEDAHGERVARARGSAGPGGDDVVVKTITLTPDALRGHAPGDWRIVVTKADGVKVDYALAAGVLA